MPPSWLSNPCPPWCSTEHQETDPPADRFHQSATRLIAVIEGSEPSSAEAGSAQASEVALTATSTASDPEIWISIRNQEYPQHGIELTLESAARLNRALGDFLKTIQPTEQPTTG